MKGIYSKLSGSLTFTNAVNTTSGAITAVNATPTGAATAGSALAITLNGASSLVTQVTAISATTLVLQVTMDGAVWVTVGGTPFVAVGTDSQSASITATGIYQADVSGFIQARISSSSGTSATISSLTATSSGSGLVAVNSALPAGSASIGTVSVSNLPATQAISAASLPLPTGAAQETGNLAAIVTQETALNTNAGTIADTTWSGSGNGTLNAILKAIYAKVAGTLTVTGTVTANVQGGNTTAVKVDGSAVTQPVSIATLPSLAAGANAIGTVSVTALPALPAGANSIGTVVLGAGAAAVGTVAAPAITKGTQGATGFMVQELKDAGRNLTNYFMALPVVSTATETLQSLTGWKGSAAVAATTTPAVVTTGKTYRVTSLTLSYTAIATAGYVMFRLRANTAGVVVVTSPLVNSWQVGVPGATAGFVQSITIDLPDGIEFAAGTGIGLTVQGYSATAVATAVGYAHAEITGFEY